MENSNPLRNIIYISVPDDIKGLESLPIDPSRLLPVEIDSENGYSDLSNLSWEMIIAAALKIIAYNPEHENADYYRKLVKAIRPGIHTELTNAAVIKAREKDFDIAEEIFLSLTNLFPDDFTSLLNLSLLYEERADSYESLNRDDLSEYYNQKAFNTYKKLLSEFPQSTECHFNFGLFYLKRNNNDKAAEHLDFFMDNSSDVKKKKRVNEILQTIREQKDTDNLFYKAYDSIRLGNEEEAINTIKQFIEKSPDVWNAWFLLGWACRRTARYEEGIQAFKKAIELGSDQIDLYNELAICLMETGRLDESRENLLIALKVEPENIKILSNLGIVSLKEENPTEAEQYFRKVLKINPDDKIAAEYLSRLN